MYKPIKSNIMNPKIENLRIAIIPTETDNDIDQNSTVNEILECDELKLYPLTDYFKAQNDGEIDFLKWTFLIDIKNVIEWTGCNLDGVHQNFVKPKKKEFRVFIVDGIKNYTDKYNPYRKDFNEEAFMTKAEEEGRVYSLKGIQRAFNSEKVNPQSDYILIKKV